LNPVFEKKLRDGLLLVEKIYKEIPGKDASKLQKTLSWIHVADVAYSTLKGRGQSPFADMAAARGLQSKTDGPFVRLFWGTDIYKQFQIKSHKIDDWTTAIEATGPEGHFLFSKSLWSDEHSYQYYVAVSTDTEALISSLWSRLGGRIHIDVGQSNQGTKLQYCGFPHANTSFFGGSEERLTSLVARHRRCVAQKVSRSYLFHGPPGTGKSSFANAFSERLGERILKLNSTSLAKISVKEMEQILDDLRPDFLLLDDVDKVVVDNAIPVVLDIVQRFKDCAGQATLIMTANSVNKFDKGLLRPGRIDTWVEFKLPEEKERRDVLVRYNALLEADLSEKQIGQLVMLTDKLSQDYLKEIVCEYRQCGSYTEVEELVKKMKTLLGLGT
jgi:cytidylate kinase